MVGEEVAVEGGEGTAMTEEEWLACTDVLAMMFFLRGRASERKLGLFRCASHRRDWYVQQNAACLWAVEVLERHFDGQGGDEWKKADDVLRGLPAATWSQDLEAAFLRDLRCIAGNPFRTRSIGPAVLAWDGETAVRLAQAIYEERAFERMPILGDALEEAGCVEEVMLAHCREKEGHVRGCWVVDRVLGRE